jgi:hypothetical protein
MTTSSTQVIAAIKRISTSSFARVLSCTRTFDLPALRVKVRGGDSRGEERGRRYLVLAATPPLYHHFARRTNYLIERELRQRFRRFRLSFFGRRGRRNRIVTGEGAVVVALWEGCVADDGTWRTWAEMARVWL